MMKRREAFERLEKLAARDQRPTELHPYDADALATLLPEMLERPVGWVQPEPPGPIASECYSALRAIGARRGLVACDESGDRCYFPRCLTDGCEAEAAPTVPPAVDHAACEHGSSAGTYCRRCQRYIPTVPPGSEPLPEVLRTMTPEQQAAFVPISDKAIAEALRKGARERALAMGAPHLVPPGSEAGQGEPAPIPGVPAVCGTCGGSGRWEKLGYREPCPTCNGTGRPTGERGTG